MRTPSVNSSDNQFVPYVPATANRISDSSIRIEQASKNSINYLPFKEGVKAQPYNVVRYEGAFITKMATRFVVSKIAILFKKYVLKQKGEGFKNVSFATWQPNKEALGIGNQKKLTPFELAQGFGFNKTLQEINKELDQVPTRMKSGRIYKGEDEGTSLHFREQLGLQNEGNFVETPFTEALALGAGVSQGYSVGTHSMMVVRMFDQHLEKRFSRGDKFKGIVSVDEFRIFLMLHDMGKGLAVKEEGQFETPERKRKELEYCRTAIDAIVSKGIVDASTGNLFKALLEDVSIGKFLKGKITESEAAQELRQAMHNYQLESIGIEKFFGLCKLFHIADASAYKNLRRIHGLFELDSAGKVRHAKTTGAEDRRAGLKLQKLKAVLVGKTN